MNFEEEHSRSNEFEIVVIIRELIDSIDKINDSSITYIKNSLYDLLPHSIQKKKQINLLLLFWFDYDLVIEKDNIDYFLFKRHVRNFQNNFGIEKPDAYWTVMIWAFVWRLFKDSEFENFFSEFHSLWQHQNELITNQAESEPRKEIGECYKFVSENAKEEKESEVFLKSTEKKRQKFKRNKTGASEANEYLTHVYNQIQIYLEEILEAKTVYHAPPLLLIDNDHLQIGAYIEEVFRSSGKKRKRWRKYHREPLYICCSPENFYDSFFEAVDGYQNKNRRFKRLYLSYLQRLCIQNPAVNPNHINRRIGSLKIKIPFLSIKTPGWREEVSNENIEYLTDGREDILKDFFRKLAVTFPKNYTGTLIIIFMDQISNLESYKTFLEKVIPSNNYVRVIASINLVNYSESLLDFPAKDRVVFLRKCSVIKCPQIYDERNTEYLLNKYFQINELPMDIIQGITFLCLGQYRKLKKITVDDCWICSASGTTISQIAVDKYIRAAKFQRILSQYRPILEDLNIVSVIFDEDHWQYKRLFLHNVLLGIFNLRLVGEFTYNNFLRIVENCNNLISIDRRDTKILYSRLIPLMIENKIVQVIQEEW